jgi:hypothetical protein
MGAAPMDDPRRYFDASPINYATFANNRIGVFLSVGTEDDLVNRRAQTDAFQGDPEAGGSDGLLLALSPSHGLFDIVRDYECGRDYCAFAYRTRACPSSAL